MELQVPVLNVINAAKAWARAVMKGVNPRHKTAWAKALAKLPPKERRLVQMVHSLAVYERQEKRGSSKDPKMNGRGHLWVVK